MAPQSTYVSESWWGNEEQRGTPVVVKMDNPYSLVEIDGPGMAAGADEKARGKNAKQFTWVLLLRAHRAVGCVAWFAAGFWALLGAINRRVRRSHDADAEASGRGRHMLRFLRAFLLLSLAMLAFETVAYLKGWHFPRNLPEQYLRQLPENLQHLPEHLRHLPENLQHLPEHLRHLPENLQHLPEHLRHLPANLRQLPEHLRMPEKQEIEGWLHCAYVAWLSFRIDYIAWAIEKLSAFCIVLFMVQSVDRVVLCLGFFWIKFRGIKPRFSASSKPRKNTDVESADADDAYFPMVLVQMPMCNEKEVSVRDVDLARVPDRLAAGEDADPGAGRLGRRDLPDADQGGGDQVEPEGREHHLPPPPRAHRVQGRQPQVRHELRLRQGLRVRRHLRRRLPAQPRLPQAHRAALQGKPGAWAGPGALELREQGREPADPAAEHQPVLPLRGRAAGQRRLPQLLRLQRHRRCVAHRGPRRLGRLDGAHHRRGHGHRRPRPPQRLEVHLPQRRQGPLRAAGVVRGLPEAAAPVALRPHAALPPLPPGSLQVQDPVLEEGEPGDALLSAAEAGPALLLLHALLRDPAADHVRAGSGAADLGHLLRAGDHVGAQHPAGAQVLPLRHPVPPLREHHVRHQVQRHGVRAVPAGELLRVDRHQEGWPDLVGVRHPRAGGGRRPRQGASQARPRRVRGRAQGVGQAQGARGVGQAAGEEGPHVAGGGRARQEEQQGQGAEPDLQEGAGARLPPPHRRHAQPAVGAGLALLLPAFPGRDVPRRRPRHHRRAGQLATRRIKRPLAMQCAVRQRQDSHA